MCVFGKKQVFFSCALKVEYFCKLAFLDIGTNLAEVFDNNERAYVARRLFNDSVVGTLVYVFQQPGRTSRVGTRRACHGAGYDATSTAA